MTLTRDQLIALLLGLFGLTGPLAKIAAALFPTAGNVIEAILSMLSLLTPLIAGIIFTKLQSPSNAVASVASLSPAEQKAALSTTDDASKVLIAQGVPNVAKIVIKENAGDGLGKLADSDDHPDILRESLNRIQQLQETLDSKGSVP